MARHVKSKHKRAKTREKKGIKFEDVLDLVKKTVEAVGILRGLQVSPNLSEGEKRLVGDVAKRIEELLAFATKA